jgi:hypothetical protein
MRPVKKTNLPGRFAITDQVLLLFNEHDIRIALNWEPSSSDVAQKGFTPTAL